MRTASIIGRFGSSFLCCSVAGTGAILFAAQSTCAETLLDPRTGLELDISYEVGSGFFTSYLIVDFEATGGDAYAFAYHWSTGDDARGYTMLEAVTAADPGLDWAFGGEDGVGFGVWVENFWYDEHADAGDESLFWSYWLGNVQDDPFTWTFSDFGASDRILEDGSVDGWYNGFDGSQPRLPIVPAPATAALLPLICLTGRRRRSGA